MVQMLFTIQFRDQIHRTRPELISALESFIADAASASDGKLQSGRKALTVLFNEDQIGFWLNMAIFLEKALSDKTTMLLRYPASKLCNILCAYEMSDRLREETDKQITANAFNPGLMTNTNFNAASFGLVTKFLLSGVMTLMGAMIGRLGNAKSSGKELAAMVTEKQYEGITKKYIDRGKEVKSSVASYDKTAAKKLWAESAELVQLAANETILSIN